MIALKQFEDHIRAHFGQKFGVLHEPFGSITPFHVDYYLIPPQTKRNFWILLTSGMSSNPMNTPQESLQYCEVMMFLHADTWNLNLNCAMEGHPLISDYPAAKFDFRTKEELIWPLINLKKIIMYPFLFQSWIGHYHTLDMEGYQCGRYQGFLLKASDTLPSESKIFHVAGKHINLYVAVPIFQNELKIAQKKGCEELDSLFKKHGIDEVTRLYRDPVNPVKKKTQTYRTYSSDREKYFI